MSSTYESSTRMRMSMYVNSDEFQENVSQSFEKLYMKERVRLTTCSTKYVTVCSMFYFTGTKWCGTGDIARDISDTGIFHDIDSCCRDHDLCPENIVAKSTKYNLTNDGSFTR